MEEIKRVDEDIFDLDDGLIVSFNRQKEDYIKSSPIGGVESLNRAGAIRFEVNNQQHYINVS